MSKEEGYSLGEVVQLYGKPFYIAWIDEEKIGLTSMCERKYYMTTTWGALRESQKPPTKPSLSQPKKKAPKKPPSMKQAMQSWTINDWRRAKE